MTDSILLLLSKRPGWVAGLEQLNELYRKGGGTASTNAASYAARCKRRRASMVFDAVASRRRKYERVVLPWVEVFDEEPASKSLAALVELGPSSSFHLMGGEADTMRQVAAGLLRFGTDNDLAGDDSAVEAWAIEVGPLEVAPALDPYVGAVKGIGTALFCYMRMRAGADAMKPDVRVRRSLERLGFTIPAGEAALLTVASVLASELSISRLVLDQLLWTDGL